LTRYLFEEATYKCILAISRQAEYVLKTRNKKQKTKKKKRVEKRKRSFNKKV